TKRARMNDDRPAPGPHFLRYAFAQERTDDQFWIKCLDRRIQGFRISTELKGHTVASAAQIDPGSLTKPVEGRTEQHHPHDFPTKCSLVHLGNRRPAQPC